MSNEKDEVNSNSNNSSRDGSIILTGSAALLNYIWNSKTGEFCGRTGLSWAKILAFYTVFYLVLATFWALMLIIFMATIEDDRPKWTLNESRIGSNPGLGLRPGPLPNKIESTLLEFRPGNNASYAHWKSDLEKFVEQYQKARNSPIDINNNPCGPNYGYSTGTPCIIVKLNRIFNWVPNPYRSVDELVNSRTIDDKGNLRRPTRQELPKDSDLKKGMVVLVCSGENGADKENLGEIEYWPHQGFPYYPVYFPYKNQKDYLSPFVMVKFKSPKQGVLICIECVAYDRNIAIKRSDREGTLRFELLIDQ